MLWWKFYSASGDNYRIIKVGNCSTRTSEGEQVYSPEGVSQTITVGTHGYAMSNILEIENDIKILGNYMPSNYDASRIVDPYGVAPCVKENHGTVTAILELENKCADVIINNRGFSDKKKESN